MLAIVFFFACGPQEPKQEEQAKDTSNERFDSYKARFVEELWKVYPEWASSQGYHNYDSALVVPDEAARYRELDFSKANRDSLAQYDVSKLSSNNQTDYYMMDNQLRAVDWSIRAMKAFEWNPSMYNVAGGMSEMLSGTYDKLESRLTNIYIRMANVPAYYEAAKGNIKKPTKEHTELAIAQNIGSLSVFEKELLDSIKKSSLSDSMKTKMIIRSKESAVAMRDYVSWLEKLQNPSPRSFRLGRDMYGYKFDHDLQSAYSCDDIFARALKRKEELHGEMAKISRQLWPKYFKDEALPGEDLEIIKRMIGKLSEKHVHRDSFQVNIEKQMPALVEFIQKKNLIYIDPSKPLVVRKEPAYMAGVAGASISAPGPYDKNGNTYYNVGSLAAYTKENAESYLREYNYYILQILNIHEAIPGHYTQLVYSNQSPSIIKALLGSSSMVEGWAVYGERMMMENGYGNDEPEMWLMYYKWHLRSVCNTILDYSVHCKNMSKDDAMDLLTREAFQQEAEAAGKWRRVSLTQVQLCCYFTGYTEIYDLREELKKKMEKSFDLKMFHEKFLSFGSAPVKHIRNLMLEEFK